MPSIDVFTKTGGKAGSVELPEALFAAPVNTALLHQAVVAQDRKSTRLNSSH